MRPAAAVSRRPRGRPRRALPNGTWIDSDVLARRVAAIVGTRDERLDEGAEIPGALQRLTRRLLGRALSRDERNALRTLAVLKREPASVITRTLVAWRHGLGEHDVRWMNETRRKALDPEGRNERRKRDLTGQPIIHSQTGQQMLHENGAPATHKPRPRVKLIYG